jgi:hypothetical protein
MIRARVEIGRDVQALTETAEGIELAGRVRLQPGRPVDVVTRRGGEAQSRRGIVHSWRVARLGSGGPVYEGTCRWE